MQAICCDFHGAGHHELVTPPPQVSGYDGAAGVRRRGQFPPITWSHYMTALTNESPALRDISQSESSLRRSSPFKQHFIHFKAGADVKLPQLDDN